MKIEKNIIALLFIIVSLSCQSENKKPVQVKPDKQKNKLHLEVDSIRKIQFLSDSEQFIDTISSPICIASYTYDSLFNKVHNEINLLYCEQTDDGQDRAVVKINYKKIILFNKNPNANNETKIYEGNGLSLILSLKEDNNSIPPDEFTSHQIGTMKIISKKNKIILKIRGSEACD